MVSVGRGKIKWRFISSPTAVYDMRLYNNIHIFRCVCAMYLYIISGWGECGWRRAANFRRLLYILIAIMLLYICTYTTRGRMSYFFLEINKIPSRWKICFGNRLSVVSISCFLPGQGEKKSMLKKLLQPVGSIYIYLFFVWRWNGITPSRPRQNDLVRFTLCVYHYLVYFKVKISYR